MFQCHLLKRWFFFLWFAFVLWEDCVGLSPCLGFLYWFICHCTNITLFWLICLEIKSCHPSAWFFFQSWLYYSRYWCMICRISLWIFTKQSLLGFGSGMCWTYWARRRTNFQTSQSLNPWAQCVTVSVTGFVHSI
jgi:hypothetical protein